MSNSPGTVNLPGMLPYAGKAAWGTSSHMRLQRTTQTDPVWIEHSPLSVLEIDVLHTALGLSSRKRKASVLQYNSKQHLSLLYSTLSLAMKAKDKQLYLHSRRVLSLANRLMQAMNLPKEERMMVSLAALFHDIGKLYIEDALLHKAESLTSQEFEVIKEHPAYGGFILGHFRMLKNVVPIVYHHHESWDGSGYPAGLSGEAIPLGARIVAIADAFEVMTSYRVYQATRTPAEALEELYLCAGTQFDPHMVEWFSTLLADTSAVGTINLPLRSGGTNLRLVGQPNPISHSVQTAS